MYKMRPKNFLLPTLLLSLALLSGAVHGETLDLAVTPETAPSRLLAEAIPGNSTDRTWRLTGPPGRRLHLICTDLTLLKSADCSDGFMSISENGAEEQKICERDSVYSRESVGNQLTVRIRTEPSSSGGGVSCEVLLVNGTVSGGSAQSAVTDTGEYLDGLGQHDTNTPDGGNNKKRIVGGEKTKAHEYPFMAVITSMIFRGYIKVLCGGSIITQQHILTAAHCLQGALSHMKVAVGVHKIKDVNYTEALPVRAAYLHEGYYSGGFEDDIAVLFLGVEIEWGDWVQQVSLPKSQFYFPNNVLKAIGWGETSSTLNAIASRVLKSVELNVVPLSHCESMFGSRMTKICIKTNGGLHPNLFQADTCERDSGGPLLVKDGGVHVQVGLITDGTACALQPEHRVHTNIFPYMEWINLKINQIPPETRDQPGPSRPAASSSGANKRQRTDKGPSRTASQQSSIPRRRLN